MDLADQDVIELFFSYAHEDEAHRIDLIKQLTLLKRQGVIRTWDDRQILPGEKWRREISTHLDSADIILLLISPDFMYSDFAYEVEMQRALARHQAGQARVIPIILRPTDGWERAPFGILHALPTGARPVTLWPDRDAAFCDIASGIRRTVETLRQERGWKSRPSTSQPLISDGLFGPQWRELRISVDDFCRNQPECKELSAAMATAEKAFSVLNPQMNQFEETPEWAQGAVALHSLYAFRARNEVLQGMVASVKMELENGLLRLAREMWYRRRWRQAEFLCEQILSLSPHQSEALDMKEDCERALQAAGIHR